jgi:hypothetical protein
MAQGAVDDSTGRLDIQSTMCSSKLILSIPRIFKKQEAEYRSAVVLMHRGETYVSSVRDFEFTQN